MHKFSHCVIFKDESCMLRSRIFIVARSPEMNSTCQTENLPLLWDLHNIILLARPKAFYHRSISRKGSYMPDRKPPIPTISPEIAFHVDNQKTFIPPTSLEQKPRTQTRCLSSLRYLQKEPPVPATESLIILLISPEEYSVSAFESFSVSQLVQNTNSADSVREPLHRRDIFRKDLIPVLGHFALPRYL